MSGIHLPIFFFGKSFFLRAQKSSIEGPIQNFCSVDNFRHVFDDWPENSDKGPRSRIFGLWEKDICRRKKLGGVDLTLIKRVKKLMIENVLDLSWNFEKSMILGPYRQNVTYSEISNRINNWISEFCWKIACIHRFLSCGDPPKFSLSFFIFLFEANQNVSEVNFHLWCRFFFTFW